MWPIAIGVYLALEFGLFVVVKELLHPTAGKLFGPYLALAAPGVLFLLLVRWLWKWEARGPSPRRLAFAWGLSLALFFLAICTAFFYSSLELQLVIPSDAVWVFGMMAAAGTPTQFFVAYFMTLERISARAS